MEVNIDFNAIGNVNEGDTAIHAVVLAVKSHHALDFAEPVPSPETVRLRVSGFETPRIVNVPGMLNVFGPVCVIFVE